MNSTNNVEVIKYFKKLKKTLNSDLDTHNIDIVLDLLEKNIPKKVILDTSRMDENFCDYNYLCPTCGMFIGDDNESVGFCDCGQSIINLHWTDWKPDFEAKYMWSNKKQKWVHRRSGKKEYI